MATTLLVACETERITFQGPSFVRFTETTGTVRESQTKPASIAIHLADTQPADQDITLNYTLSGNAREGVDYTIVGTRGQVTIPKGQWFGYIQIKLINNANNILRSQDVVLTLIGVSKGTVGLGEGKGAIGHQYTFTILDDCILGGTYAGKRSALAIPTSGLAITSSDCETYLLSNWNVDVLNSPFDMDLRFIDNGDNTLTIPEQEEENLPDALATILGSGFVNPATGEITLNITLKDFQGSPSFSLTLNRE